MMHNGSHCTHQPYVEEQCGLRVHAPMRARRAHQCHEDPTPEATAEVLRARPPCDQRT